MSLSRSESFRKPVRALSVRNGIIIGAGLLLFLAVGAVLSVRTADADYRRDERQAHALAKREAGLIEIRESVHYTWEESMWILRGRDAEGVEWYVWQRADGIVKEKASDVLGEADALRLFREQRPDADVIRVLPGWFQNEPAWEIRYKQIKGPNTRGQAVDFYAFRGGGRLKTYDLPGLSND